MTENSPMRTSASVVMIRNGKIAAIRSAKHGGALELPGGKSEPGETPEANAQRECCEEVGVYPRYLKLLLTEPVGGFMCSTFLAEIKGYQRLTSSTEGEAGWFTPAELLNGTYAAHTARWLPMVADELTKRSEQTRPQNHDEPDCCDLPVFVEWCEADKINGPEKAGWCIWIGSEVSDPVVINFCPNCGKKLVVDTADTANTEK